MEERIRNYLKETDELLQQQKNNSALSAEEWQKFYQRHLIQISFFQHERLIHLIVTVTFAILTVLAVFFDAFCFSIGVTLLVVALMILLIPYIRHYYMLENGVQKMYRQYDEIEKYIK